MEHARDYTELPHACMSGGHLLELFLIIGPECLGFLIDLNCFCFSFVENTVCLIVMWVDPHRPLQVSKVVDILVSCFAWNTVAIV